MPKKSKQKDISFNPTDESSPKPQAKKTKPKVKKKQDQVKDKLPEAVCPGVKSNYNMYLDFVRNGYKIDSGKKSGRKKSLFFQVPAVVT